MNDVVFVMANSKLKKKDVRKTKGYNIKDLASDKDILVEVGEDGDASRGGAAAPMDDLEVPPIIYNDEGHGGEEINESEDHVEVDDHYPASDMKDFLGSFVCIKHL